MTPYAHLILRRLQDLNMSQRDFERAAGVSHSTISKWVGDRIASPPEPETAKRARRVLKISAQEWHDAVTAYFLRRRILGERYDQLNDDQRAAVDAMMLAMLQTHRTPPGQ